MVIAKISTKGQITIPKVVRQRLNLNEKGDIIGFEITSQGVIMKHLNVTESEQDYTENEWKKIEQLARGKGKTFKTASGFLGHLKRLSK
ncbi:MAG: AbrB/MazE/SpoVT family DNA-binding domain-containing protein [Candidatus Omnitrophota bacterium]